eukprot:scaffold2962_cov169-Amphora_coffeaeformis.AAC.9
MEREDRTNGEASLLLPYYKRAALHSSFTQRQPPFTTTTTILSRRSVLCHDSSRGTERSHTSVLSEPGKEDPNRRRHKKLKGVPCVSDVKKTILAKKKKTSRYGPATPS